MSANKLYSVEFNIPKQYMYAVQYMLNTEADLPLADVELIKLRYPKYGFIVEGTMKMLVDSACSVIHDLMIRAEYKIATASKNKRALKERDQRKHHQAAVERLRKNFEIETPIKEVELTAMNININSTLNNDPMQDSIIYNNKFALLELSDNETSSQPVGT